MKFNKYKLEERTLEKLNSMTENERIEKAFDLITASSNVIENTKKIKGIMRTYEVNMRSIGFNYTRAKDIVRFSLSQALTFNEKKEIFIELMKHDSLYEYILNNIFGYSINPICVIFPFAECNSDFEEEQLFDIFFEKIIKSKKDTTSFLQTCSIYFLSSQLDYLEDINPKYSKKKDLVILNYLDDKFKRIHDEYGHDLIYSNKKFKHTTGDLLLLIKHMTDEEILYIISILNTGLDSYDFEHNLAIPILRTTKFKKEIDAQGILINFKND